MYIFLKKIKYLQYQMNIHLFLLFILFEKCFSSDVDNIQNLTKTPIHYEIITWRNG